MSLVSLSDCVGWRVQVADPAPAGDGTRFSTQRGTFVPFEVVDDAGLILTVPEPLIADRVFLEPVVRSVLRKDEVPEQRSRLKDLGANDGYEWSETLVIAGARVALYGICVQSAGRVVFETNPQTGYATIEILDSVKTLPRKGGAA